MTVPKCLAIIPDGNRRMAERSGCIAQAGHELGRKNCAVIAREARRLGVQHVAIWAASTSNLQKRLPIEVAYLYHLLRLEVQERLQDDEGVRFRLIGNWRDGCVLADLFDMVDELEQKTVGNSDELTILFGYDGLTETIAAYNSLVARRAEKVDEQTFMQALWTANVPKVNLLIRTGVEGDLHLSDSFLPFQTAQAQLYTTPTLWPDFSVRELHKAFEDFGRRPRRKGA